MHLMGKTFGLSSKSSSSRRHVSTPLTRLSSNSSTSTSWKPRLRSASMRLPLSPKTTRTMRVKERIFETVSEAGFYEASEAAVGCVAGIGVAEAATGGAGIAVPVIGWITSAGVATAGCVGGAVVSVTGGQLPDSAPEDGTAYTPRHSA